MICIFCNYEGDPVEFIDEICDECIYKKHAEEDNEFYKEELKILNQRLDTNFNFKSFSNACHHEQIDGKDLKDCPKLWHVNFLIN